MSGGRCAAGIWRWYALLSTGAGLRLRGDRLWGKIRPTPFVHPRVLPQLAGNRDRIDAGVLPPGGFVADTVHQPVMDAAERNCEFVAGLAAKRPRLHKSDLMGVRGLAAAQQARLLRHEAEMLISSGSGEECSA